jgi:ankyrin repeat protein
MGKFTNFLFGAPLHVAAGKGDIAAVQALLEAGADVNQQDALGATPILYAAANGKLDIVKFLLHNGADVNAQKKDGMSALIMAAASGHSSVVRALIEHGADVNAQDATGQSPLDFARTVSGDKTTIDILSNAKGCAASDLSQTAPQVLPGTSANATSLQHKTASNSGNGSASNGLCSLLPPP